MNSNKNSPAKSVPVTASKPARAGLNLTPEEANREARKLHEFRDDLGDRPTSADTAARTAPVARTKS